ncbi:hypothetical protein H8356DRAFT_1328857 [Neocallimastix lanati (nom. inval.)]|nr:hypothetical protein H8356DRAFT_1328857 [Neocallimastix sp. JGI-2020a]
MEYIRNIAPGRCVTTMPVNITLNITFHSTHDSGTYDISSIWYRQILYNTVKYLDIRLDIDGDDNLQVVHGPVYCIDYQTIIIHLKDENNAIEDKDKKNFAKIFTKTFGKPEYLEYLYKPRDQDKNYDNSNIPTLGVIREYDVNEASLEIDPKIGLIDVD